MKTIIIRDEIYETLKELKGEGMSFSDVIEKLLDEKRNKGIKILEKLAGKLKESDIETLILKERKKFRVRKIDI